MVYKNDTVNNILSKYFNGDFADLKSSIIASILLCKREKIFLSIFIPH